MTIKEAVEKYNESIEKITKIKHLTKSIVEQKFSTFRDPFGTFRFSESEVDLIVAYLNDYTKVLEEALNEEFK